MTATARGRVTIAVLVGALAFAAAFAVRKATAGTTNTPALPAPLVLPATAPHAAGVALPVDALPTLRHPPHPVAPVQSTAPSPTPATPTQGAPNPTPAAPAPSQPATPPSGGGKGSGPVLVG
jgi:hypothetical protein